MAENRNALEIGDPDGVLLAVADQLGPMLWSARSAEVKCMVTAPGGAPCAYDPRSVLAGVVT